MALLKTWRNPDTVPHIYPMNNEPTTQSLFNLYPVSTTAVVRDTNALVPTLYTIYTTEYQYFNDTFT